MTNVAVFVGVSLQFKVCGSWMTDPVDELAEIRERKQLLSEREKELREIILCDDGVRTGLNYVARVSEQTTIKTDWKELAISLGATQPEIDEFSSETTI